MTQTNVVTSGKFADPNQAAFLQQLVDDPALRHELESDPIATLGRFGIEMDPAEVPEKVQLPDSAKIHDFFRAKGLAQWLPFFR